MQAATAVCHGPVLTWCAAPGPRSTEAPFGAFHGVNTAFHALPLPPVCFLLYGADNGLAAIVDGDVLVLHGDLLFSASILFQRFHLDAE